MEEITLDFKLGLNKHGKEVFYKQLLFEGHIQETLKTPKFKLNGLSELLEPNFKIINNKHSIIRKTQKNKDQIYCQYIRKPKVQIYDMEDWNDYTKLIEQFKFISGFNSVTLTKNEYSVVFEFASGNKNLAKQATIEGFKEFKKLAGLKRELTLEDISKNKIKANFGTREDNLPLQYEIALQDEILFSYLQLNKTKK